MVQYVVMEAGWDYNDETYDERSGSPRKIFPDKKSAEQYSLDLTIETIKDIGVEELKLYNDWKPVINIDKYREIMGIDKSKIGPLKMMLVLGDKDPDSTDEIKELPKDKEKLIEFAKNMEVQFFKVVKVE